jgi:hypothetical protein
MLELKNGAIAQLQEQSLLESVRIFAFILVNLSLMFVIS